MYLIPEPKQVDKREGEFLISYESCIVLEPACDRLLTGQAKLFKESIEEELGYGLALIRGEGQNGDIILRQSAEMDGEAYRLEISAEGAVIEGGKCGIWLGMQTLRQIIEQCGAVLPALMITDAPDIPNRGFYHDVTRGRVPKLSFLKKLVDRMAYYKLNQLQLYIEHTYLFRNFSEIWRDDTPLTAADILEIDRYCLERGIELVPSLSCFGHLYKLLSSRSYSHLCELEGSDDMTFSLRGRMHHHTINVSDPESLVLIKNMIAEFMPLFTSGKFNICADETFDLGKGRSRAVAEEKGIPRIYMDYVKELCRYVVENGKQPMFWGDVICSFPEMIKELPEETICLNWGYARLQREDESKHLYDAGATQYSCPGVGGWNQFVPLIENSYENISRMCSYAAKYNAIGVLNTDWGDFLHINHPELSLVGMIYGAAFSWNREIPSLEEINRRISRIAFHDESETVVETLAKVQECTAFGWESAVRFKELYQVTEFLEDHKQYLEERIHDIDHADDKNRKLTEIQKRLYEGISRMDRSCRTMIKPYLVAMEGIRLFNEVGKAVYGQNYGMKYDTMPDFRDLAERLEKWLYHYKAIYRSVSLESELYRIQDLVVWYADGLRKNGLKQ